MHSLYFRFSGTIVLKIWVRYRAVRNYFNLLLIGEYYPDAVPEIWIP